jgi:hypothetical protein
MPHTNRSAEVIGLLRWLRGWPRAARRPAGGDREECCDLPVVAGGLAATSPS